VLHERRQAIDGCLRVFHARLRLLRLRPPRCHVGGQRRNFEPNQQIAGLYQISLGFRQLDDPCGFRSRDRPVEAGCGSDGPRRCHHRFHRLRCDTNRRHGCRGGRLHFFYGVVRARASAEEDGERREAYERHRSGAPIARSSSASAT
jgi:hypothetical protein